MHVLGSVLDAARGAAEETLAAVSRSRSFRVFVSNCSGEPLVLAGRSLAAGTACAPLPEELPSGRAVLLQLSADGELGGAVELRAGDERLLLGARSRIGGRVSFSLEFATWGGRTPQAFCQALPSRLMGSAGAPALAEGARLGALASRAVQGTDSSVHVVVGPVEDVRAAAGQEEMLTPTSCVLPAATSSARLLEFAEWCAGGWWRRKDLGRAVFLSELAAMQAGLDHLDLADRALAVDLLAAAFVEPPQVLGLRRGALEAELRAWRAAWEALQPLGAGPPPRRRGPARHSYRDLPASTGRLQARADAALVLLQTAALQSALAAGGRLRRWSSARATGGDGRGALWAPEPGAAGGAADANDGVLAQHLLDRLARGVSCPSAPRARLHDFIQECVQVSADFARRSAAVVEALRCRATAEALRHYAQWVPGQRRNFATEGGSFESWGAEVFAGLDGGALTRPERLIESLGRGAPPYKEISTNSKSGEFFFFSGDRRFVIKTISQAEAQIFYRMLPGYQAHLRLGSSLIVRYGGLHCARMQGADTCYFTVMTSVFDTAYPVHETFDIKGSTFQRRRKKDESIGKDEDWIEGGYRLRVNPAVRRMLRAVHERDADFFAAYRVMDYSLLVGIHHVGSDTPRADARLWKGAGEVSTTGGFLSADGKDVYFVGLIDFLIFFGQRKEIESIWRMAQGHGEDASCVNPMAYAMRQVSFVQDSVLEGPAPPEEEGGAPADWGQAAAAAGGLGVLRATVVGAHGLRGADLLGLPDTYAEVRLGLQSRRTPTIRGSLDPEWDCVLLFAVDEAHREAGSELEVAVWHEGRAQGRGQRQGGLLGRLRAPVGQVIQRGSLRMGQRKLQDATKGELSLQLEFLPLGAVGGPRAEGGARPLPRCLPCLRCAA